MCFTVSVFAQTHVIETDTGALFDAPEEYQPYYHVSGFVHPHLPVITNDRPDALQMFEWGLIPRWTKNAEAAEEISQLTLNARSETIFDKPSFRDAIVKRRALLPVTGFVEWQHEDKLKLPHLITVGAFDGNHPPPIYTLGCIWEEWADKESGEVRRTFSIVTTQANTLMSFIHNNKQRMPVVIPKGDRMAWLQADDREIATRLMRPLEDGILKAYPISRAMSRIKVNTDDPSLLNPIGEAFV